MSNATLNASSSYAARLTAVGIVYIGLEVTSEVCLTIVLLTYLFTKRRETVAGCLMINFCLSLLLLYVESSCNKFIVASGSINGCLVVAVLGHWFFLSMLISLAAYALWIYLKIVRLFSEEPRHYKCKAFFTTWVVPPVITAVCVAPDHHQYGRSGYFNVCKGNGYAFYLGIILPTVILLLFSVVVMTLSVVALRRKKAQNGGNIAACHRIVKLSRRMRLFLCLLIMAVIGWGFALVASDENVPTVVLFIAVVPFLLCGFGQGVFIFLFVCVFNSKVRQDWKTLATCQTTASFTSQTPNAT